MERRRAEDFDQDLLILFDAYVHGDIDRRGFLDKAAKFAVGGMTAAMLLEALSPKFAEAQQVAKDDTRLKAEYVEYDSPQGHGRMRGYLARPAAAAGRLPAVLVVHENRGLNPHIEDIARRVALDNFLAFAPDALFPLGGYPGTEDEARALFPKLDQTKTREDFIAAVHWLMKHPQSTGKVGVVGFCYGGLIAHLMAVRVPELAAAVPFYGTSPSPDDAARVKAPLLIHFAENDQRVNASFPPYEEALKANKVQYQAFTYPGTQHGFNNDTTPRYDPEAAKLAWTRTIEFFNKHLR
ncbi:MAG TPA: dienelactone hydrolase family protein [Vicinamibacterales bacterium]|nr:dienelactone hydrolase family protein [Vicinamibacterales bacterium]